jgi:predicted lipoprotein
MNRRLVSHALLLASTGALFGAAHGCAPMTPPYDRAAMLSEMASGVIVPGYESVEAEATALHASTTALCAAPDLTSLSAARDAWRATLLAWDETLAWDIGPASDVGSGLGDQIQYAPSSGPRTDAARIEMNIAGTDVINDAWVDGLGNTARGLPAIEYLLFSSDDAAVVLTGFGDARRCDYLEALAAHVERTSSRIVTEWTAPGTGYATFLSAPGTAGGPASLGSELSAVTTVVTQIIAAIEGVKVARLGQPLGHMTGTPDPTSVESPYGDASVDALSATLRGARRLWSTGEHSLDGFVRSRNARLADAILADFDGASSAVAAVPSPFVPYVSGSDHTLGDAAYDSVGVLERVLLTDASTTMAVSIGGNFETDGD